MQLFTRVLPEKCEIILLSDTHIGSALTHYNGIKRCIDYVLAAPNRYVIVLGDLCESISTDDLKRFDMETVDKSIPIPMLQYQYWIDLFRPVADRILYINEGNHDHKHSRYANFVRDVVCRELGIPWGTYSSKLTVVNGMLETRFKIYTSHGYGSLNSAADDPIRQKSNMRLSLKRKLRQKAADCVLMAIGHTHQLIVSRPESTTYLYDDGEEIHAGKTSAPQHAEYIPDNLRWYVNTGSFLKSQALGISSYAERAGYNPNDLGYIVVTVDNDIQDVRKVIV